MPAKTRKFRAAAPKNRTETSAKTSRCTPLLHIQLLYIISEEKAIYKIYIFQDRTKPFGNVAKKSKSLQKKDFENRRDVKIKAKRCLQIGKKQVMNFSVQKEDLGGKQ